MFRMPVVREFEKQKVAVSWTMAPELAYLKDRLTLSQYVDEGNRRAVFNLHTYILKGPEKETSRFETNEVLPGKRVATLNSLSVFPTSPWNYFKAEVVSRLGALGRWWLRRWPVEVKLVGGVTQYGMGPTTIQHVTNVTRETRTCRHLHVPGQEQDHFRFLMYENDNPGPPPRPRPYCPVCMSPPDHPARLEGC